MAEALQMCTVGPMSDVEVVELDRPAIGAQRKFLTRPPPFPAYRTCTWDGREWSGLREERAFQRKYGHLARASFISIHERERQWTERVSMFRAEGRDLEEERRKGIFRLPASMKHILRGDQLVPGIGVLVCVCFLCVSVSTCGFRISQIRFIWDTFGELIEMFMSMARSCSFIIHVINSASRDRRYYLIASRIPPGHLGIEARQYERI